MSAKKIFVEHCEHEWLFEYYVDGNLCTFSLKNLSFVGASLKHKDDLFNRLSKAFEDA